MTGVQTCALPISGSVNGQGFKAKNKSGSLVSLTDNGVLNELFNNVTIPAGDKYKVDVYFDPKVEGPHSLNIEFPSNATQPTSQLAGIGVFPKLETQDLNFAERIVGLGSEVKTFVFSAINWPYDYPVTITDFVLAAKPGTIASEYGGNGILRWDRANIRDQFTGNVITLPYELKPNSMIEIDVEFEPTDRKSVV